MISDLTVKSGDGVAFEDGEDRGRILVFGWQTGGRYSLMEYAISPRPPTAEPSFGPHRHENIEETFLVRSGTLRFLLDETVFDLSAGDVVRVPPGVRHGFANVSRDEVSLLVSFHPGGFEELFVTHRSDQHPPPPTGGFVAEAMERFASRFEP